MSRPGEDWPRPPFWPSDYPILLELLGREAFERIVGDYVQHAPLGHVVACPTLLADVATSGSIPRRWTNAVPRPDVERFLVPFRDHRGGEMMVGLNVVAGFLARVNLTAKTKVAVLGYVLGFITPVLVGQILASLESRRARREVEL